MSGKPLAPRREARIDIEQAVHGYRAMASEKIALRFTDAVETALARIARHPAAGSPSHGQRLRIAGLRSLLIRRYPYLVFYVEFADRIEIWRVLHAQRDIDALIGLDEK